MNGIINVLKPSGMTSHDVVAYIRKITGIKKVGHSGTLDPSAVGVLPVFIGKATKAVDYALEGFKSYRVEMKLGITTDTGDKDGNILSSDNLSNYIKEENFDTELNKIIQSFKGKTYQIPPMYSAVKINGQKLYNLARQGKEIIREARKIDISRIEIINFSYKEGIVLYDVDCSKGTYMRVLCEDIGKKIGCGAFMSYLIRTKSSSFCIQDSYTIEEIKHMQENNNLSQALSSVEKLFGSLPEYVITNEEQIKKFMNGCEISINQINFKNSYPQIIRIYIDNEFIGIADCYKNEEKNYCLKVRKFFA
ncbi:MAG: tRNA pseudouridine(55) synthase TruB [Deltaproteobacteria bacterium]